MLKRVRADGVTIREATRVERVERRGRIGIRVDVDSGARSIEATHLLIAAGRAANIAGLDLDKAGIRHEPAGITVSPKLRTSNSRVYAVGDVVAGAPQFTHVASYHAGIVIRALLFRLSAKENRGIIPRVTFTDPELAHVGLTEADALALKHRISILRWPYAENDRAQAERRTQGHIKLVTDLKGGILGASIVGANAGEMIGLWALALAKQMNVREIADFVAPYPTMSEIGKRAAISYFVPEAQKPLVRKLIRFLRVFG